MGALPSIGPLVRELSGMVEGLDSSQLETWLKVVEEDARKSAPPAIRDRIAIPRTDVASDRKGAKEFKVSRSAVPYIIEAIDGNKESMPEGTRAYFQMLEDMLAKEARDH